VAGPFNRKGDTGIAPAESVAVVSSSQISQQATVPVRAFAGWIAVCAWAGLALQTHVTMTVRLPAGAGLVDAAVHLSSFFTIWTNLVLAIAMTASAACARLGASPYGALTTYIVAVGLIYWLVLSRQWQLSGLPLLADSLLHYIGPSLTAVFWVTCAPKAPLHWRDPLVWMAFPLTYGVVAMVRGAFTGIYPYPFLQVPEIGMGQALINLVLLACVFGLLGALLVGCARILNRSRTAPA
jgi:hypothetical protein